MKKLKLLLMTLTLLVGGTSSVNATDWTGNAVGAGTFYLYNVGADKFLNFSDPNQDWGTNAWLSTNSNLDVTLANVSEGVYTIDTKISNGNDSHYLNESTWCDGGATEWTFRAVAGETNVYQIIYNGQYIMANEALNDVEMVGDPGSRVTSTYWKLVTKDDRIAALANASESNPMDATFLIEDANFGRNDQRQSAWTITASNKNLSGGNNKNNCAESFHSDFSLSQVLSGIPNGWYRMTAQGFYRKDGAANDNLPEFYLGTATSTFPLMGTLPDHDNNGMNSMADASVEFTNGNYTISPLIALVNNGTITVGGRLSGQNNNGNTDGLWCIWDNFVLTYYGNESCGYSFSEIPSSGVDYTTQGSAPKGGHTYVLYNQTGKFLYNDVNTPKVSSTKATYYTLETTGDEFYIRSDAGLLYKQSDSNWNTWADGVYGDVAKWKAAELSDGKYTLQNHNKASDTHFFAPNSNGEGVQCYSDKTSLTGWYFLDVTNKNLALSLLNTLQQTRANTYDTFAGSDAKDALGKALDQVYIDYVCTSNFTSTTYDDGVAAIQAAIDAYYASRFASLTGSEGGEDITSWITNPTPTSNADGWDITSGATFDSGKNNAEFWNKSAASLSQTITLPAGYYRLTAVALTRTGMAATLATTGATSGALNSMNISTVGSGTVNDRSGANTWFNEGYGVNELDFYVSTKQDVTISLTTDNTTGDHWMVWRSFQLTAVGNAEDNLLNLEQYLDNAAVTHANTAKNDASYVHVTGTERTSFESAITALTNYSGTGTTAEKVAARKTLKYALVDAYNSFYKRSTKNAYDEYYYENETATRLGADASGVSAPTTAAKATTAAHAINVINYNKFVAEEYADVSATVLGEWTDNNVTSRTAQHWSGDTSKEYFEMNSGYGSGTWSMSRQQTINLAAGSYVLRVAARVSASADAQLSVTVGSSDPIVTYSGHHGDSGLGITTSGEACYISHDTDETKVYSNGNNGRGFEWRYIPFTLASTGEVTLKFYAENASGNLYQYVSFCDLGIWTDPKVAARTTLLTAINNATAARKTANEGTGIFQIPVDAGETLAAAIPTAQGVYDDDDATLSEIVDATTAMTDAQTTYENTTLYAPNSSTRYKLTLANLGTLSFDDTGAADEGGYGLPYKAAADYMAQTFFLVQQSGNNYKISFEDFDGNTRYICTAENAKEGEGNIKIRTTTDDSKALVIKIAPTATANVFNMLNTAESDRTIGSDGGGLYTANENTSWTITEASQANVSGTLAAGKYATRIFPFTPSTIEGITYYSCETSGEDYVVLTPVETPAANTPYLLYNNTENSIDIAQSGWGTATADSYTEGLLTGVFTASEIAANSNNYILQTQGGVQCFYKVGETARTATAYRAYLTLAGSNEARTLRILFSDDETTGIEEGIRMKAESQNAQTIYDLQGRKIQNPSRGMYIINGKKVIIK